MKKIRDAIIANARELGAEKMINDAVALVPSLAQRAGDVPGALRTISLDDLVSSGRSSKTPLDREILDALRVASETERSVSGHTHVRAVKIAELLKVTTSTIRRRLAHLEKIGRITAIGQAAGKRYALSATRSS